MKIAILIYDGFTALDAVGPYEVLSCLPGAKVHFVSTELGPKRAHTNFLSVMADYTLNDISDPEIILVPGGNEGNDGRGRRSAHTLLASKSTRNFEVDYLCLHGITNTRRGRDFKRAAGNNALVCPRYSGEVRSSVPE